MDNKTPFIEALKKRTKLFTINIIAFVDSLSSSKSVNVISYQLLKSSSSIGANYRAACRARSGKEFFSKLCIVVEEADESEYWLEVINESNIKANKTETEQLPLEAGEILRITSKARNTASQNIK